jgi:hypothetical protein
LRTFHEADQFASHFRGIMTLRLLTLTLVVLTSGCLTPVGENNVGVLDGGASTGGGNTGTGGASGGGTGGASGGGTGGASGGGTGGASGGGTGGASGGTGGGGGGGGANNATVTCSADGFCWERAAFGGTFHAVHGVGPNFVVAVGDGGVIATWDGTRFTYVLGPVRTALRGVWFESTTHGYAVGDQGTVLEFNSGTWTQRPSGTTADLFTVHGNGSTLYIGGRDVLLTRGTSGFQLVAGALPVTDSEAIVRRIRVVAPDDVWAVGAGGVNFFIHYNGAAWVDMYGSSASAAPTSSDSLYGLDLCGTSLFVSGSYSGEANTTWVRFNSTWDNTWSAQGGRVVCLSATEFLSFGSSYYGGESVQLVSLGTPGSTTAVGDGLRFEDAFAAAPRDVWFVGAQGQLTRWTGGSLPSTRESRAGRVFAFASDNVWLLKGDEGLERFDGSSWSNLPSPGTGFVVDLYSPHAGDAWLVHQRIGGSVVLRLQGGQWVVQNGFHADITYVRGASASDVWFSGPAGLVQHWNGTALETRFLSTSAATGPMHVTATQVWVPTWTNSGISTSFQWTGAAFVGRGALGWRFGGAGDDVYFTSVGALHRFTTPTPVLVSEGVGTDHLTASSDTLYVVKMRYGPFPTNTLARVAMGSTQLTSLDMGTTEGLTSLSATPDGHVWATTAGGGLLHKAP